MQAAPTRYVSVSELYSTDEVELLLEEIRELEPTSCRGEDVQDFEIAGSGGGGGAGSPAGTDGTERSWDSHAQYLREPPPQPQPLAPLYCRPAYLLTHQGLCTLVILLCSISSCGCVWGAVGVRLGGGDAGAAAARALQLGAVTALLLHAALLTMRLTALHRLMPLDWDALVRTGGGDAGAAAARALQLGAVTALLLHAALLTMRLTALHRLMPLDWDALSALCGAWAGGWQLCGALLLLRAVLLQHARAPPATRHLLLAAIGLSLASGGAGALVATRWTRACCVRARARARDRDRDRDQYSAVPRDSDPDLQHDPL